MIIKKFPSEEFPQIPSVEINVYEGWKSQSFPNSVIGLVKNDSEFSSNILIDVKKVEKSYDFISNTIELQNYTHGLKKLNIFSDSVHKINGLSWKVEEFAYINKDVGAIAQLIAVSFFTINDTKFMINFTGTTKLFENEKNEDYEKIQEMLGSIKVYENQ